MEPEIESFYTWPFDATAIILRYFFFAGTAYIIFYRWKQKTLSGIKIQKKAPPAQIVRQEILNSLLTLSIYCVTSLLVFEWQKSGITKIYLDIHRYSYAYFMISIVVMIIVHDTYFYWTHRLLHLPKFFKWIHKTHHHSDNPTPWAAFSFHPLEAIISAGIIPIIVFIIPCHPFALFSFLTFMTFINVIGHLGYETFSKRIMNNKILQWQNTSTNHNIHHQRSKYNFGLYFTFWDRVMKTYQFEEENK